VETDQANLLRLELGNQVGLDLLDLNNGLLADGD